MPAYDFKCTNCDTVFEIVRSVKERSAVDCPICGTRAQRIFTPVGVVFKGSGFHNTDYRKKEPARSDATAITTKETPSCDGCASCMSTDPPG